MSFRVEGQRGRFDELPPEEGLVSDLSLALGMHTDFVEGRGYQGWYGGVPVGMPPPTPEDDYQKWTSDMWESLGVGKTVGEALAITMGRQTNGGDPNGPVKNFRFKGQWIDNIRLVGN